VLVPGRDGIVSLVANCGNGFARAGDAEFRSEDLVVGLVFTNTENVAVALIAAATHYAHSPWGRRTAATTAVTTLHGVVCARHQAPLLFAFLTWSRARVPLGFPNAHSAVNTRPTSTTPKVRFRETRKRHPPTNLFLKI
jgi:hypothetical protein